ncbi:MAG: glycerate kinase [Dermatophilaceae bacterium]|jgi:glycerate kinase|nr:glycerate kinase [Dermatophilaceae bacterium]MBP9917848.1 glycerate kinase [Dermatophilaceae bacterium]
MRVLIAPQRFGDALSAVEAAEALASGWALAAPDDVIMTRPIAGAGAGMLAAIAAHRGGDLHVVSAVDALGSHTLATILLVSSEQKGDDRGTGFGSERTAYLDAGEVCGVPPTGGPPDYAGSEAMVEATTWGLGQLILAARDVGATKVIVGLDDAAVLDLGAGMLAALAGCPEHSDRPDRPDRESGGLRDDGSALPASLVELSDRARNALGNLRIHVAGDLHAPLLGLAGVSASTAPRWGASAAQAQDMERQLGEIVDLTRRALAEPTDLLTGQPVRIDRRPGVAAGAGLGFGFALLGATIGDGHDLVLSAVDIDTALDETDLVVSAIEILDPLALHLSAVPSLAAAAGARGIPVVTVAGMVSAGRRELMAAGLSGSYALASTPTAWLAAQRELPERLRHRSAAVARTWSPSWRQ